jgi:hypothetical protein
MISANWAKIRKAPMQVCSPAWRFLKIYHPCGRRDELKNMDDYFITKIQMASIL